MKIFKYLLLIIQLVGMSITYFHYDIFNDFALMFFAFHGTMALCGFLLSSDTPTTAADYIRTVFGSLICIANIFMLAQLGGYYFIYE